MKLLNHVLDIRHLMQVAITNQFDRLGLSTEGVLETGADTMEKLNDKTRLENIINDHQKELGNYADARQYTINECVFTLFNRIAAIKVMEAKELFPPKITTSPEYGNHSYGHQEWLQAQPSRRDLEREGLKEYLIESFDELGDWIPLFKSDYPYQLLPTTDELYQIISAFNAVEQDPDCGAEVWNGDDILGWLYENFNAVEKEALKASGEKTEYDKVSLQSQVYTPQWVVKFLVDNTLGKLYLEMFPDSNIVKLEDEKKQKKYLIANAPTKKERREKSIKNIRVIDPACGSGNFLIYAFSMLYDLYENQIEQYGANIEHKEIAKLIVENNLYGVDLDERAAQLSQIALFIKARELGGRRGAKPRFTHVVSSHFFLPEYEVVQSAFENNEWDERQQLVIRNIWSDLRDAYKFGTLVRVENHFNILENKEKTLDMFASSDIEDFKKEALERIRRQVLLSIGKKSNAYTLAKTNDAISYLEILSTPFDVVVANPPYTDSADFGDELKKFVENNYKKPLAFNSNLYACFIKRCCELAGDKGKVGMIHPHTFMFIQSFADVRKFLIEKTHINVMVDYGLDRINLFGPGILLDATFYTLDMSKSECDGVYLNITDGQQEKYKRRSFEKAFFDHCSSVKNERVYILPQDNLKLIKSYPFIYWISDEYRSKFGKGSFALFMKAKKGLGTENMRFFRFWWEVDPTTISSNYAVDKKKWVSYLKGGPYNKWYGNIWLVLNWENDGYEILHHPSLNLRNPDTYFKEGIACSLLSSKGCSFRYQPSNCIYDSTTRSIFLENDAHSIEFFLGLLNSKVAIYTLDCLNATVATNSDDIHRIPFAQFTSENETLIEHLVRENINIKKELASFSLIEPLFRCSPISAEKSIYNSIIDFYNHENFLLSVVLLNEAIIDEVVFDTYGLNEQDRKLIDSKEGVPIATLPVSKDAQEAFLKELGNTYPYLVEIIKSLPTEDFKCSIKDFDILYTNNNRWEDFCVLHNTNPIEVWYQFSKSNILPSQRTQVLAFELLADVIRSVLAKDNDGVIPLMDSLGEERLGLRIEQELHERGYDSAQISQIFQLLGTPLDKYLQNQFFAQLSDHLNLFMYLPKTPFIWHIASGPKHAMELYISIYKWSRDTLYRVKSVYAANREASLRDQVAQLRQGDEQAKARANDVQEQLDELLKFSEKLDDLLASGYNPKLDDGVGKNIAPLQKRGLLAYDVLNSNQLKKYLNADW